MSVRRKPTSASAKVDKALDAFEGLLAVGFAVSSNIRQNRELATKAVEHFGEAVGELFTKDEQTAIDEDSTENPQGN